MLRTFDHGSLEYNQIVDLRDRVLRKPLGLVFTPEQLAAERDEIFLADFREGAPVATLQFQTRAETWKMRQVAVDPEVQGQGVGSRLVRFSEDWALRSGAERFVLHARESAAPFYERLGYEVEGPMFEEVGIPHFKMTKDLRARTGYLAYTEAFPLDLHAQIEERPLAVLPWGALEWHGDHLPLGLDGIVAEEFAKRLAARCGGVLFPTTYLPITTLPHDYSLDFRSDLVNSIWDEVTRGLVKAGFTVALIVSGHYAQGHEWELYGAAERAAKHGLRVLAASPLEVLEEDDLLDHAGKWETACLSMFRPALVRLQSLEGTKLDPARHAVLGGSPLLGDPIEGWEVMDRAWNAWSAYADRLLAGGDDPLRGFYSRRRENYQEYRDAYFKTSWEQAIQDWWSEKTSGS